MADIGADAESQSGGMGKVRIAARLASARGTAGRVGVVLASLAACVVLSALFLRPYLDRRVTIPVGLDTPKYIWRAKVVAAEGLDAILKAHADRPGHPTLASLVQAASGVDPMHLSRVLPAVMAIAIGLAAAVFLTRGARLPAWTFAFALLTVGGSIIVARTAVGYADNLIADSVLLAAAFAVVEALRRRRGVIAAIVLLAGAALIHWIFTFVFLVLLCGLAVCLLPRSVAAVRAHTSLARTDSVRLGLLTGAAAAAGLLVMAIAIGPSLAAKTPAISAGEMLTKWGEFLPLFHLPITIPVAVLGAAGLLFAGGRDRRPMVFLTTLWGLVGLVAGIAVELGAHLPAYRVLGFSFGIPILCAAAFVLPVHIGARLRGAIGAVLGGLVLVAALFFWVGWTNDAWNGETPVWNSGSALVKENWTLQIETVGNYLQEVHWTGPVIFVSAGGGEYRANLIRTFLPTENIRQAFMYVGPLQRLLDGKPTIIPGHAEFNRVSRRTWPAVRKALHHDPVIVQPSTMNRQFPKTLNTGLGAPATAQWITPGIAVIRGPVLATPVEVAPPLSPPGRWDLVANLLAVLAVLAVAGVGWSVTLLDAPLGYSFALAPAFGAAVLVVFGVVASRLGVPLSGGPAWALVGLIALAGWAPSIVRGSVSRLRRRSPA